MHSGENKEQDFRDFSARKMSKYINAFFLTTALVGLYWTSRVDYLLFHILAEVFSILVALTAFLFTWNLKNHIRNNFLLITGISFLFIGFLDLAHILAYKGMPAFFGPGFEATKLWIAARYTQSLALLVAVFSLNSPKRIDPVRFFAGFAVWTALLFASILWWDVFPVCFTEGTGLTPFKKISEYVICGIYGACVYLLVVKRDSFEGNVFRLILMSIGFAIVSELAFTFYVDVYGLSNLIGHYFKIFSFFAIYVALVRTGLKQPFDLIFRDMKQAEERLIKEREFSRCLLESMADGVVACDADGLLTLFNRTAREWHGMDPMRLPREEWSRCYDLYRADGVTPLSTDEIPLAMAFKGEAFRDVGMTIVAKGQAPRSILANGSAITDADGRKLGAVVVMRDITEFRRLEQELRQANEYLERRVAERTAQLRASEEKYRELIQRIQIAVIVHGADSRILTTNVQAQRLLGLTEEQLAGKAADDPGWHFLREDGSALPPEEFPVNQVLTTGKPLREIILGLRHPGAGKDVWGLVSADPVRDQRGDITQVIVTFVDISGRKRAEDALILREREYHALLDNIPDLIVRYDTELRRTYVNQSWEKSSGLSWDEVVDVPANAIPRVPLPIVKEYEDKLRRVLDSGTTETCGFSWVNAFGAELYLEYVIVPEHDRSGGIIGALAIGRELSERRRAEEEMRRLNRELRAISKCNQVLVRAEDEQELLNDICRIVCDEAGYRMAWVGLAENDEAKTVRAVAWYGIEDGYLSSTRITWADTESGQRPSGRAIRSGQSHCIKDFMTDPQAVPWREDALRRGYRSSIALPLKDEAGSVFGAFMIHSAEPDAFTPEESRLLGELSEDMAFGITTLRARAERAHDSAIDVSRLHLLQFAVTHSLDELLEETLNEAEKLSGSLIGFYHFVDVDQQSLTLQNWSTRTKAEFCKAAGKGLHYAISEAGVWVDCVHQRRPVIHNDYASLPHRKGMPEGHAPVIRELVVPVLRGSRIKAILGVGNKPSDYGERDVKALSLLADLVWEIADRKRAEELLIRQTEVIKTLLNLHEVATSSSSFQEFMDCCNEAQCALTRSKLSFIGFLDETESVMTLPIWSKSAMKECKVTGKPRLFPVKDAGLWVECVLQRKPFVCNRYEEPHPGKKGLPEGHARLTRFISIPMMVGDRVAAVSVVANKESDYEEMDVSSLLALTNKTWEIHELKKTEERVRRLAASVEQAALDVVITDARGNILYTNPSVTKTTGYTSEELLGKNPRIFKSGIHDQDFYRELWDTLKAGQTWNGRIHNRTKDGRLILQNATISPIRDEKGEIIGFVATRRDITKEVEMEEHLAQAQKMEALGTLSGGIAHDFNNILTAIVGFAELSRQTSANPEQKEYLDSVLKASARATELIKQILSFSRMSKGEAKPVQPKLILKEAMKFLRASIPTTIEFRQKIVSDSKVVAEAGEIHRIIINLCTNASLAMKENSGVLEVSLEDVTLDAAFFVTHPDMKPGRYVCITVKDSGCGMTEETREHIFEPFFTTRKEGEGTGMGLSVVHGIVKSRGGAISVTSEPGKGTTFQVFLPVEEMAGTDEQSQEESPLPGDECILFVDDEGMLTRFAETSLGKLGYRIAPFTNSSQALECFRANPDGFDLIITDMTMPGMPGDVLAQKLREIRSDIPVIFCTGFSERLSTDKIEAMGNSDFALKPLTAVQLSRIIRRIMAAKEATGRSDS